MKTIQNHIYTRSNIYSTLFPLYITSTVFGLAPLRLKNHNRRKALVYSKYSIIRTVLLVIIYSSILCYFFYMFKPIQNVLCKIRFYQEIFSVLLYFCEIAAACIFSKKIVEVFRNIDDVDEMLIGLKISVSYTSMYLKILLFLATAFLGFVILFVFLFITEMFLICYSCRKYSILMEVFTYSLPFMTNFLMELQYFQYLDALRCRYKELNIYLLKNIDSKSTKMDFERISTITKVYPKPTREFKSNDPLYKINQVTKIHMILTDTARLVNKSFQYQQLLKIAVSFVSIITGLFLFAMIFAAKDPSKLRVDMLFFIWTFCNALEMFAVVGISAETCRQGNYCPIILHRIRNSTTTESLKKLIDLHSLQMYHSKLMFSVCGLFPLDYSLLFSVVAGATTYLVILIQFNMDMVKAYDNGTIY